MALPNEWVERRRKRVTFLEAFHTTHIAGAGLSLAQAERLWAGDGVSGIDRDGAHEFLNCRDAFHLVAEQVDSGEPITETMLCAIHSELLRGVRGGAGQPGSYRTVQNFVTRRRSHTLVYMPPPAGHVGTMMAGLVEWLESEPEVHPVVVAGIAQLEFTRIHPFVDGNGRMSRLLSMMCLYRSGYDFKRMFTLSDFYDRDVRAYYRALRSGSGSGAEMTAWLEYFATGLAENVEEIVTLGLSKTARRHHTETRDLPGALNS